MHLLDQQELREVASQSQSHFARLAAAGGTAPSLPPEGGTPRVAGPIDAGLVPCAPSPRNHGGVPASWSRTRLALSVIMGNSCPYPPPPLL